MASLDPKFHEETVSIHKEHEELVAQLDQMDACTRTDGLLCGGFHRSRHRQPGDEPRPMDGGVASPALRQHEETTVLETIARMSPELASFAREMKRQHNEMRVRLESFRDLLEHLSESERPGKRRHPDEEAGQRTSRA